MPFFDPADASMGEMRNCVIAHSVDALAEALKQEGVLTEKHAPLFGSLPFIECNYLERGTACLFDNNGTPTLFRYAK